MTQTNKPTFVNIGADDVVPILVNVDDLVCVQNFRGRYIFDSTAGQMMQAVTKNTHKKNPEDYKDCEILADDWLERIDIAGKQLSKLTHAWLPGTDEAETWVSYVNPDKVAYVTVHDTKGPNADPDTVQYFVALEQHVNRMESHATPRAEIEAFIAEVEEAKGKKLTMVDPEEASPDILGDAYAVFDPEMITTICANGFDIRLEVNGTGYPLDLHLPEIDDQPIFQQIMANDPDAIKNQNKVFSQISRERRRLQKEAHTKMSAKLAAICSQLTEIPGADDPFYTRLDTVETISYHKWDKDGAGLTVLYNKNKMGIARQNYPKQHTVRYKDADKALKIFNQMAGFPHHKTVQKQKRIRSYNQKRRK